ncbi:hypothetical protein [Sphingobacterium haloxyli]|uniref:Uncharacterized protein n=1 Tax=Sphingobacterium haloxyli TaxID=2100533 RepID=A0A2S9J4T2_9SPHI|nr:hypothetical protein [Sphingobacterium haloxyli]PRD47729.1 hypothetical protein C5745_07360 [Sphingobacterium haloxyli]
MKTTTFLTFVGDKCGKAEGAINFYTSKDMLDDALLRRFDLAISLELPDQQQIQELIQLVLKEGKFAFGRKVSMKK